MHEEQLIIHYKKIKAQDIAVMFVIMFFSLFFILFTKMRLVGSIVYYPCLIIFYLTFGFFLLLGIFMLYANYAYFRKPAAILNDEGIWLPRYGLIPWEQITEFKNYAAKGAPLECIGICVQEPANGFGKNQRRLWFAVKMSKMTGYPPINLSNIDRESEAVISYAQRRMFAATRLRELGK